MELDMGKDYLRWDRYAESYGENCRFSCYLAPLLSVMIPEGIS